MSLFAMIWQLYKLVNFISLMKKLQIILAFPQSYEIWNIFIILSTYISNFVFATNISLFMPAYTSLTVLLVA